jgi:transcription antitermination factor NusG
MTPTMASFTFPDPAVAAVVEVHPWYAVRVKSRQEHVVGMSLAGKGFERFLPLFRSVRRWSDRVKELDLPLFQGYVFARFDFERRLPILQTPGVVHVVGFGSQATPIPEDEIAAIQAVVGSGLPASPWPFLEAGRRVRVERGPLEGTEGILVSIKNRDRIVVSISLLQRSVSVEIDRNWIRPISR